MKKAFTIVELAIVLVVIGIILSMVVRGKSLVDTAILKAEVNKLHKLEAAMHVWLATHPNLPIRTERYGDLGLQSIYDLNIVSPVELRSSYDTWLDPDGDEFIYWPMLCNNFDYNGNTLFEIAVGVGKSGSSFCAALTVGPTILSGSATSFGDISYPMIVQCAIENMLDDNNVTSGIARRGKSQGGPAANIKEFTADEYNDCRSLDRAANPWGAAPRYYYKLY